MKAKQCRNRLNGDAHARPRAKCAQARLIIALALALLFAAGALRGQPQLGLEDYLELAVKHSPELKAGAVRLNAAELAIESLPRWYLPDLYVEAGYGGAVNSDEDRAGPLGRIVGAWTLWDGGRSDAEREVLERQQELIRISDEARALGIRKTLALAYYRAARLEELRVIARQEIAAYERLERSLAPRRRIGGAGASDVLNVRVRAGRLREADGASGATILALRRSLLILAGVPSEAGGVEAPTIPVLSRSFEPPSPPEPDQKDQPEQHPRYRVQQARLRLLKARGELVERELYATTLAFEMYGGYGPDLDALDPKRPEAGAGIRFRFPLFASRDREGRLGAEAARLEAARLETQQRLIELRIEFLERAAGLARDRRLLAGQKRLLLQARRSLRQGYEEFRRGQKAPADMIAAIETLYELKRERLGALFRMRLARFETYALAKHPQHSSKAKHHNDYKEPVDETEAQ
ncbi:MAG: TolC family protein [Leptospirales bacterium]|jgi:outer membrane protein TolC